MKRSDMVKIIAECIGGWPHHERPLEVADTVLKAVEEAGMKPPDCNYHNSEYGIWDHWEEEK